MNTSRLWKKLKNLQKAHLDPSFDGLPTARQMFKKATFSSPPSPGMKHAVPVARPQVL
jgi:hypothetical protein